MKNIFFISLFTVMVFGCKTVTKTTEVKEVGTRGWHTTVTPFAEFNHKHPSVEIWTPNKSKKAPIIVYAHGDEHRKKWNCEYSNYGKRTYRN